MPLSDKAELTALMRKAGINPQTAVAVMEIDALMQKWRRRAARRELGQKALIDLKIELDLAQLDVLFAIEGPTSDADEATETMVATVADRLMIDPSRASRLVSEMVELGYARRAVSQADARRTIIELTELGRSVVETTRAYKLLIMGDYMGQWPEDEIASFVPLLKRFATWLDGIEPATEKHAEEIAALARQIGKAEEPA